MAHQNNGLTQLLAAQAKRKQEEEAAAGGGINGFTNAASTSNVFNPSDITPPQGVTFPTLQAQGQAGAIDFNSVLPSNPSLPQPFSPTAAPTSLLSAPRPTSILGAAPTPTIDPRAAQAALRGAPESLIGDPRAQLSGQPTPQAVSTEAPSIGDRILGNLADSRFGQFLGKIETVDLDPSGNVRAGSGEAAFPALREQAQVEPFGSTNPAISGIAAPVATPESVANLSFTGTPLTPETITGAGAEVRNFPEVPLATAADFTAPVPQEQFDPTQVREAPSNQGLTTLSGQPLSEFLAGGASPEAGLVAAQPLGGRGDTGAVGRQALQDAGIAAGTRARADGTFAAPQNAGSVDSRQALAAAQPVAEGSVKAQPKITMAAAVRLSNGNRPEARAMMERQKQGIGEFAPKEVEEEKAVVELTPEAKAAAAAQLEGVELQNQRTQQIIAKGNLPEATAAQKWNAELEESGLSAEEMRAARLKKFGLDAFDFPDAAAAAAPTQRPNAPTVAPTGQVAPLVFSSEAEALAANLPSGTRISINGRLGTI